MRRDMCATLAVIHWPGPRNGSAYITTTEPVSSAEPVDSWTRIVSATRPTASPTSEISPADQIRRKSGVTQRLEPV